MPDPVPPVPPPSGDVDEAPTIAEVLASVGRLSEAWAGLRLDTPEDQALHDRLVDTSRRTIAAFLRANPSVLADQPAGDTTTESGTEYRAVGTPPQDSTGLTGVGYVGASLGAAMVSGRQLANFRFADVRIESRTVTTTRVETPWKAEQT